MITIHYKSKTIVRVTNDYIDILDDDKREHRILFTECAVGWIEHVKQSLDFEGVDAEKLVNSRCVAVTHKLSRDMYIRLFSDPIVTLKFQFSLRLLEPSKAFDDVKNIIRQMGWKTYDMS